MTTRIIKGSLRYKSSPDVDSSIDINLENKQKEQIENDRNVNIDKQILFDEERQRSTLFRPSAKLTFVFRNILTGSTDYTPFRNNLYFEDFEANASLVPPVYVGYPQFSEFDFIRTDVNVSGYTQPPNEHIKFISQSASSYNWGMYISYVYANDNTSKIQYTPEPVPGTTTTSVSWSPSQGIPYVIKNLNFEGENLISFRCPVKHNLNIGDYVKLNIVIGGTNYFQVYSFGDGGYNSEFYVFNILNFGFAGFVDGDQGFFKRIANIDNPIESESQYYVRKHKILTQITDAQVNKAGFENLIYGTKFFFETGALTPDNQSKSVSKESSQSYTVNYSKDIDIRPLLDNQKRPISELYLTIFHRGYFGWFYPKSTNGTQIPLKQGFEFNLFLNPNTLALPTQVPDSWWGTTLSNVPNIVTNSYTRTIGVNTFTFNYSEVLPIGFIFDGDYCEWNNYDQQEYVLSDRYHKISYNRGAPTTKIFETTQNTLLWNNPYGFYYKPLYKFTIRDYSPYVEEGDKNNADQVPNYSFYSPINEAFRWRDLYTYGYIDSEGVGVDYPFLNGSHYPYENFIFRLIPEGSNYQNLGIITDPTIDGCE